MDKHVTSVLSAVIIALLLWIGSTVSNNKDITTAVRTNQENLIHSQQEFKQLLDKKLDKETLIYHEREMLRVWKAIEDLRNANSNN